MLKRLGGICGDNPALRADIEREIANELGQPGDVAPSRERSEIVGGPPSPRLQSSGKLSPRGPMSPLGIDPMRMGRTSESSSASEGEFLVPDMLKSPDAYKLAHKIFNDEQIAKFVDSPSNNCFASARRVAELVHEQGVEYKVRGMLSWTGVRDTCPDNHFAVCVNLDGKDYVIDPTAAQFGECKPMVVEESTWKRKLASALQNQATAYKDYGTPGEAQAGAGALYQGGPMSFEGSTSLVTPDWFNRLKTNSVARRKLSALAEKEEQASSGPSSLPA